MAKQYSAKVIHAANGVAQDAYEVPTKSTKLSEAQSLVELQLIGGKDIVWEQPQAHAKSQFVVGRLGNDSIFLRVL